MRKFAILIATVLLGLTSTVVLGSADASRAITIMGTEHFVPNALINADFRFSPGPLAVKSGETVTWTNATTDGHTISIVPSQPSNVGDVFNCGAPGTVCAPILACHFPQGFGQGGPPPVIVPTCGNASNGELKALGDSFLIPPPGIGPPSLQTITAKITAAPGTTLLYMCVIHPWMQGQIVVG